MTLSTVMFGAALGGLAPLAVLVIGLARDPNRESRALRLSNPWVWIVNILVYPLFAMGLAWIHLLVMGDQFNPLVAFELGAAIPLIIQKTPAGATENEEPTGSEL